MNINKHRKMHAQIGKKVYIILFLVFVGLPIYWVFERNFVFPLFFNLFTCTVGLHPFTEIPVRMILAKKNCELN